jgi:hypothetical protein
MEKPGEAAPNEPAVPDNERASRIAMVLGKHLTRRYRRILYAITGFLVAIGLLHGYLAQSPSAFQRYGAIIALATFWHAHVQQRYLSMMQHDAEPVGREVGRQLGKDPARTTAHLERLRSSIQRSFNTDYLICGSIGAIVWGFGDLLFV